MRLFDLATDTTFTSGIIRLHNEAKPLMNNMTHHDDRRPNKTYVRVEFFQHTDINRISGSKWIPDIRVYLEGQ